MNQQQGHSTAPASVISADGTPVAFEKSGTGPALILIGGALNDRNSARPLAALLEGDFTVFRFDRRGRGDSGNTLPYSPVREVEDVGALLEEAGGTAFVYGHSSGGFLALLAAAAGLSITRLAIYEAPYAVDQNGDDHNTQMMAKLAQLIDGGEPESALIYFFGTTGMPAAVIEQQRQAPHWPFLIAKAPTLIYELKLKTAAGNALVPVEQLAKIHAPVKAMAGGASPDWMRAASEQVAQSVASGTYLEFAGQNHMVANEVIAPTLRKFFLG